MSEEKSVLDEEAAKVAKLAQLSEDQLYEKLGETSVRTGFSAADILGLVKHGRAYYNRVTKALYQEICVKRRACEWEKSVLEDAKTLAAALLPLVFSTMGGAPISAIVLVTSVVLKRGIRKFCHCPKKGSE